MKRIFVYEWASGGGGPAGLPLLAAGLGMRDALLADLLACPGVEVTCATCGRVDEGPACERLARAAPGSDESAPAFVSRLAWAHDAAWIVAPETDGILEALHEAVGPRRWIGCDMAGIRRAASKSSTLAHLAARGIATPLAFAEGHEGPWIVKPDDGAGSLHTRVHATRAAAHADLAGRRAARQRATLEPYVEGAALSISLLVGRLHGPRVQTLAINRQHLHLDAEGWLHDRGVEPAAIDCRRDPRAAPLRALAHRVADAMPGLCGFVGVDAVWNPRHGPVAIEVNPRVTCAYVGLSRLLGRNLAAEVLDCAPPVFEPHGRNA
jgi:predicted ATP-grasp superfamily ATP-dependent carboligase